MTATLIGRDHPAGLLRAEVDRATQSHGGLVLVTGEAGIGKTTLVASALDEAQRQGALVLSGSCWDSANAPGYWPWVQVLRGLRRSTTGQEWAAATDTAGPALSVLLGEPAGKSAADEFELYDAVTTALVSVAQRRPVLVALDDLHWADTASLRLLEFAARHTWFERLLLVGTYRDVEVDSAEHPLRPLIAPLLAKATTVTLTGLDRAGVGALIARTAGDQPDDDVVGEVHRRTGGNPFFVEQTARLWRSGSPLDAIAPGVRDAVWRRLAQLPEPVVQLLRTAAVLGREFHRQLLAATAAAPVPQVDRLLEQAVTARLITPAGGGRFGFSHDLVRESLYDSLDEAGARGRHAAVVLALEEQATSTTAPIPAELARHAYLAGDELDQARAVDHLVSAARDAGSRLATDEAIGHFRRAFERAAAEPRRRVVIGLDLGNELHHSERREEAWQVFTEAVVLARQQEDAELLARAAITLYRTDSDAHRREQTGELLREAHRRMAGSQPVDTVPADELVQQLIGRLAELGRQRQDDDTLAFGLWARHDTIWGPGTAAEREALTDELSALARRTGDRESEVFAASLKWVALLEQGDPRYLEQYNSFVEMASRGMPRSRFASAVDQSIICALLGRFADAEAFLDEAVGSFGEHNHPGFLQMALHVRWQLLLLQGRFDELAELHRETGGASHPHPRLLEGITAARRGDRERVLELADAVADGEPYPRESAPLWLRFNAQAAAASSDPQRCERARTALEPLRGQWLVSMFGIDVSGPADLWFGMLDIAQQRWDDAITRLTAAHSSAEAMRARPWSIEARVVLAEALRGSGEAAGATKLLDEVRREAAELGMRHLVAPEPEATGPPMEAAAANAFRLDGSVWTLTFDGHTVHMADTKGLRDLHTLLGRPGSEVSSVRLLDPAGGAVLVAARRMGGDDVLDDEAKSRYRRRLAELDEQIDRAVELGSDGKAAELDTERAALLAELRSAAGLAGRDRRLGDEAERARKTVTARIRDTLRKLDGQHPSLAAHLRASVATGSSCAYQPDPVPHWHL